VGGVTVNDDQTQDLMTRAARGDGLAWDRLLSQHRSRLRRVVASRMDPRLRGRIDPSDVLQEAYLDAARRLPEYVGEPTMPFFLWLRFLVGQRILEQHRRHLDRKARDVNREARFCRKVFPATTTHDLAAALMDRLSTPSRAAIRKERSKRLQQALESLEPIDREILVLRHFEQLTNGETAEVLELDKSAASKRYARALVRLKDALRELPGGLEELAL